MSITTEPIVGHRIRVDAIGPTITHPIACQAVRKAVDCPHYQALAAGRIKTAMPRGNHLAVLIGDQLYIRRVDSASRHEAEEILGLIECYADEVGQRLARIVLGAWSEGPTDG